MGKINQPYDLLEDTQFLRNIIEHNYALNQNEYRPLQEFDQVMRQFARDYLRNYLFRKYDGSKAHEEIEQEARDFELEVYGTGNNEKTT